MSRLLFWIALAILVVFAIRAKLREAAPKAPMPGRRPARREADTERMAHCAHCGVYFPASESVSADGRDYCCPAHVRQPPLQ
jgi:uncharacterized protein